MVTRPRSEIVKELQALEKLPRPTSWEELRKHPIPPRTAEVIGIKCADTGCFATRDITYKKPLCYRSWQLYDSYELEECSQCHWFVVDYYRKPSESIFCRECRYRKPTPLYAHGPVERNTRFLYILKLNDGTYYVGQTNALDLRLKEHIDGVGAKNTRGKEPRLVWYAKSVGKRHEVDEREMSLTLLAVNNPRAIRRMVAEWQQPLKLVHLE